MPSTEDRRTWTVPVRIADWGSVRLGDMALALDGKGRAVLVAAEDPTATESPIELESIGESENPGAANPSVELRVFRFRLDNVGSIRSTSLRAAPLQFRDLGLSVNQRGNGLITWRESESVALFGARLEPESETLGKVETIAGENNGYGPVSARSVVLPDGSSVVLWRSGGRVFASRSEGASGRWTQPRSLGQTWNSPMDNGDLDVAADELGNLTAVWTESIAEADQQGGTEIVSARWNAAEATWTRATVARRLLGKDPPVSDESIQRPVIVAGSCGDALIVWSEKGVYSSYWPPRAKAWSEPRPIAASEKAWEPTAVLTGRGDVTVAYGNVITSGLWSASASSPDFSWTKAEVDSVHGSVVPAPLMTASPQGDVVVVWADGSLKDSSASAWRATRDARSHSWTRERLLGGSKGLSSSPRIASNQGGQIVIVWQEMRSGHRELWMTSSGLSHNR